MKVSEEKLNTLPAAKVTDDKDSAKLPRKITEEFLVNNNLPASIISSVTSQPPTNGIWSGVARGSEGGMEEKDSKYSGSTIDSEPPSFSSSVTEDVELLLPGGRRFGVAKDDLEEQVRVHFKIFLISHLQIPGGGAEPTGGDVVEGESAAGGGGGKCEERAEEGGR